MRKNDAAVISLFLLCGWIGMGTARGETAKPPSPGSGSAAPRIPGGVLRISPPISLSTPWRMPRSAMPPPQPAPGSRPAPERRLSPSDRVQRPEPEPPPALPDGMGTDRDMQPPSPASAEGRLHEIDRGAEMIRRELSGEAGEAMPGERAHAAASSFDGMAASNRPLLQAARTRAAQIPSRDYPNTPQGRLLRQAALHLSIRSGGSIEEISRNGAFAYVDFLGLSVQQAGAGRDPDVQSCHVVFYLQFTNQAWNIHVYRRNARADTGGRPDRDYVRALKTWLIAGGIPRDDISDPPDPPAPRRLSFD